MSTATDDWQSFADRYPFAFDSFQVDAIETLAGGQSIMVAAPTGAGKTVVAEFAVWRAHSAGGRVLYTTPIKALSNQKYYDLRAIYGDAVGLLTGDVSENPGASIVVMTTEILRNMLMQTPWELTNVTCVVFDEIHFLADPERGAVWEESIILCPEHIQLVCLSATVSNAAEVAAWIGRTHRPIRLVTHLQRAVPLTLFYYVDGQIIPMMTASGRLAPGLENKGGESRGALARRGRGRRPGPPLRAEYAEPSPVEIVNLLDRRGMLPAIFFLFARRDCESAADQTTLNKLRLVRDQDRLDQIDTVLRRHLSLLRQEDLRLDQVQAITRLARRGIGFHHAGLLPPLKRLVEELFTQRLMGIVFATDTLALGVNMPARTVVIGRMSKYDGIENRLLLPNEFQQMAGRAGRRGLDREGAVIIPYSPWLSARDSLAIATGPLLPVMSGFAIRYNSALNLWDPPRGSRVRMLLQRSLHQFQTASRLRDLEAEVLEAQAALDSAPRGCLIGYPDGDELLHEYESLGRALSAARDLVRQFRREESDLRAQAEAPPWPQPSREALRRAFRHMQPGAAVHHRREGWGLFLGPGNAGPGLVFFGKRVVAVAEYSAFDYLTPATERVNLPPALTALTGPVADVTPLLTEPEQADILAQVRRLELPDLAAWRAESHAQREQELAADSRRIRRELTKAEAEVERLITTRQQHPCEPCEVRKQHQRLLRRRAELDRDHAAVEQRLQRQLRYEQQRVDQVVASIAGVLQHYGYLERGALTAKSAMLANVFDPNGLIICETIDRGWLDDLEPDDAAEFCSWFAFSRDTRFGNRYLLPARLLDLRQDLEELQYEILVHERRGDLAISTGYNRGFYGAVRAWCRGDDLASISEQIELSEGDLVTTFNKTLDLMRQLRDMLLEVAPEHRLRHTLDWAIKLVQRDIVEQSHRLHVPIDDLMTPGEDGAPEIDEAVPPAIEALLTDNERDNRPRQHRPHGRARGGPRRGNSRERRP